MIVVADTHAHLYPCYDVAVFLATARRRLAPLAAAAGRERASGAPVAHVLCLTERASESAFADIASGRPLPRGWRLARCGEPTALRLETDDAFALTLIAGRQIVTAERLEVLALATGATIDDGLPLAETVARVRAADGLAVLPWSPGKWLGRRGRIVRDAIDAAKPAELLVGDTALRPRLSPAPTLFTLAGARGLGIICGSDPLPLPGEERHVGRYATVAESALSPDEPSAGLRALLCSGGAGLSRAGSRRSALSFAMSWTRHALSAR